MAVLLVLYVAGRRRSALPSTLSEALLGDLKGRLQAQGRIPPLPEGWQSQSAMLASDGVGYAGDFLVADLREDRQLEVVLVDVCGKGVGAGPAALQFAGALGGLIGALPPERAVRRPTTSCSARTTTSPSPPRCTCSSTSSAAATRSPAPATRPRCAWTCQRRVADRQRPRHGAGRAGRTPSCTSATAGCPRRGAALLHRRRDRGPLRAPRRRDRLAAAGRPGGDRDRVRAAPRSG